MHRAIDIVKVMKEGNFLYFILHLTKTEKPFFFQNKLLEYTYHHTIYIVTSNLPTFFTVYVCSKIPPWAVLSYDLLIYLVKHPFYVLENVLYVRRQKS